MTRADRLVVWLTAAASVASQANIVWTLASLQPSVPALQMSFTAADFRHILDMWGPVGTALYRSSFAYDTLHPFIYGAFGYLVVSRTQLFSGTGPSVRRFFLVCLPVAALLDLLENGAHLWLLSQPRGAGALMVPLSGTCSAIKWALATLFAVALAVQIVRHLLAGSHRP